jgi:membrane protein DedA with SNARE-associated domain
MHRPGAGILAHGPSRGAYMNLIITASLTEPLVNFATDLIGSIGYAGIFVLMTLESACIPIPSEATMLFAGFKVDSGDLTLFGIVAAGVLGNLAGSWIAYAVGYYGRIELLEQNKLIHVNPKHLATADDWFERYGSVTVFFTRMLPIIRTFISLPAGVARMPFWRFTVLTVAGCLPWVLALALIGKAVGENWEDWKHNLEYFDYAVALAIVVGAAYLFLRWRRQRGEGGDVEGDPAEAGG